MRRIILTEYLTLDGVMQDPHDWITPYWTGDLAAYMRREMRNTGALLLGRATWEAAASPGGASAWGFGVPFASMPSYVVSTTLTDAAVWPGIHVLKDITAVSELRDGDGPDFLIHGSGQLARSLVAADLIDEYRLLTFPVVRGGGQRLFATPGFTDSLIMTARERFPNGVIARAYSPAEDAILPLDLPATRLPVAV